MEIICRDIETLALVFPGVSFTVSTIRQPSEINPRTDRVLHIPKVLKVYFLIFSFSHRKTARHRPSFLPFVTQMVKPLLMYDPLSSKMSTLSSSFSQDVDEVAVVSGATKLEGFISLRGSRTKESISHVETRLRTETL